MNTPLKPESDANALSTARFRQHSSPACLWLVGVILAFGAAFWASPASAQTTLLSTGAVWKYVDTGADLGTGWTAPGFDDLDWASGPAELGFGDGDEATTNLAGAVTYYYRTTFNVPSAAAVTNLRARLLRDDGAVVYLNGVEAFRDNMPTGEVVSATLASGNANEPTPFYSIPANPALLVDGVNVVAVEVHQSATNSSDVSFNFELIGNPMPSIVINTPTNSQTVVASTVVVGGTATPGGPSLTLVEVFAGTTKIGESTNESFGVVWQDVVPGNYTLLARMTDSSGLRATSAPVSITVQAVPASVLIPAGSVWRYLDTGVDQGTAWTAPTFSDAAWKSGAAQLGYGDSDEATVMGYGDSANKYPTYYFRKVFTVNNPSAYTALTLTLTYDDGAVVYINGTEVYRIGMPAGTIVYTTYASAATDYTPDVSSLLTSVLVPGTNVIAVEVHQCNATSSDVSFDLQLEGDIDNVAPIAAYDPDPGSTLLDLTRINVIFSESVIGVDASDLLINGEAATSVVTNNPNDFSFYFSQPSTGTVRVAWTLLHGITDLSSLANPFAGGSWSYTLDTNVSTTANFIISEFLADNNTGIRDEDGNRSDWIEIKNAGVLQAILDGYYLTDTPTNLTKWKFPSSLAPVQANDYLLVWASAKNRTNPVAPLHTNFKLAKEAGNFLALVSPQGQIVSAFTNYPAQQSDVSYGRDAIDPNLVGYFTTPTPRKVNSTAGSGFVNEPIFSVDTGIYTNATLTVTISLSNAPAGSTIRYTFNGTVPTSSSLAYTGPFTIGTNAVLKARVFPPAGTNVFPSAVVAKSYIFLDGASRDFNSNLPLMIIDSHGQQIVSSVVSGGTRTEGSLVIIDTTRGRSSLQDPVQFHGTAGFEGYGQTSLGFAKPQLRLEIHNDLGNDLDVPLLGMPADSDWRMRNPYDDKTLMNDFLAYELFEDMGHYSLRRRFVEVFLCAPSLASSGWSNTNRTGRLKYPSDYAGVLVLFETIKVGKDRVDVPKLTPYDTTEPNVSGGYIFKKDKDSNGDINFSTVGSTNTSLGFGGQTLKVHEPNVQDLRTTPSSAITTWPGAGYTASGSNQLRYLVSYLNQMERALYRSDWTNVSIVGTTNHYSYYMDVDAFVDQHWLVEFTKQIDGYRLSSYYSKDRLGKVAPYPVWDWNLSFGNAYYLRGGHTNGWYFQEQDEGMTSNEHIWLRRLINGAASMGAVLPDNSGNAFGVGGDPEFNQKIADRWTVLRTNVLNGTNVLRRIDELSATLSEAAARDLWGKYRSSVIGVELWPNPNGAFNGTSKANHPWDVDYVKPTNYLGNATNSIIGNMKKWVLGRYLWIDGQFTPQPRFNHPGGEVTNGFTLTMTVPPNATNWYTLDGSDPRLLGGGISPSALRYTGPVTITSNVLVFARAKGPNGFYNVWSGPAKAPFYLDVPPLRITEVMYHPNPPPGGTVDDAEFFEFIEVKNIGLASLNVSGFSLGGGITFVFPSLVLSGGQSAVVVKDVAAFQYRYGTTLLIAGTYAGNLNNAGDHIVLLGRLGETIHDFTYGDNWHKATDGPGFSLVIADENSALDSWNVATGWRPSAELGGSPAADDPLPPLRPPVVVNEVLTHSDTNLTPGLMDAIELYNPSSESADVSGWFLTDDFGTPQKFLIPEDTVIPPGGYVVFWESEFNADPDLPTSFGLSAQGDEIFLFSTDPFGELTGYAQGFDFGAQVNGVSFGRHVISTGNDHFVAQRELTLGTNNAGPLVGPIVITELMYHPTDQAIAGVGFDNSTDEYIELQNIGGEAVSLYDTNYPTNTWRLREAVEYDFPTGVVMPPGSYLLVVPFDPNANAAATAAWRARNFVPETMPLYGPWTGELNNGNETVELRKPDLPITNSVPSVLVERVKYSDEDLRLAAADGLGLSLQRIVPAEYGNDPANWAAAAPNPGGAYVGGTPPTILSQPVDQFLVTGDDVQFSVEAIGSEPLRYQWRYNGLSIDGATNATYAIANVPLSAAGTYSVFVFNGGGSAVSSNFVVNTRVGLRIIRQPVSAFVLAGASTNFSVLAEGTGRLRYQWSYNGVDLPNGTNSTYPIASAQTTNAGTYVVLVSDDVESVLSTSVMLTLVTRPVLVLQPILTNYVVEGGTASLSAMATGSMPIGYRWRFKGVTITSANVPNASIVPIPGGSVLTVSGARLTNAGNYSVVASNVAGTAPVSSNAWLVVLADTDQDGLPDAWENSHAGFSPTDPSDGARDEDGDGMANGAEYYAGTDYMDPASFLKVDLTVTNTAVVQFNAVSNRTYSVQYAEGLNALLWEKLGDVPARTTSRLEMLIDPNPGTNRFYRIVTPTQP